VSLQENRGKQDLSSSWKFSVERSMNFILNSQMNIAVDVPFIYVILCKKRCLKESVIVTYRNNQKVMSDPKPSKPSQKIVQDWVEVHDDFADEPILCPIVKKPPRKAGTPQRYVRLSKWEDDPGEAIQDPDYWINHLL
jgi:hypothetical protein